MKTTSTKKISTEKTTAKENTFPVVAIGASAGGLEAMIELLTHLPADTGMAFIYVQHLSPDHKSMLTEILSKKTEMPVQEIDDMDKIQPNNVFVMPFNKGIEVSDGHIKLIPRSDSSVAITIDILFSTLAEAQKERVIGVVLSGSASDGTLGIKAIKHEGGLTFAQDDSAKFTSMPHSAIASGNVDFILSPKEIALELGRLSKHPLIKTISLKNGEEALIENSNPDLKIILNQLFKAKGVDFSVYKMNTIKRRIIRRMLLYKIPTLKEYAKQLSEKNEEIDILYQDLLINVTSFFRDTDTHKYLKENLFPKLLKGKKTGESLRIWVPACATGEEAYSMAMMLLEIQESKTTSIPVQIFATDLSEHAINKARIGHYTKQELEAVSPKRIQRFFNKADSGFRVNKAVRDMCVFALHNILHDPPFSRLDFISCCNLFIYLDNPAQKKAVNTFHYALNEDGFLMLGKSENITQSNNLFTSINKKYKIFSRKKNTGNRTLPALLPRYTQQSFIDKNLQVTNKNKTIQKTSINHYDLDNAIDTVLISEFMPASVVINYQMEIVQFRGETDLFLTHPKGRATFNILKMARPEIAFELRNTTPKVIKTKHRIRKIGIEMKINSEVKIISLEIVPLQIESDEPLLLILFTEQEQAESYSHQSGGARNTSLAKDSRIKKLELELAAAHADALAIAQEQEAFTEELQSANEEIVSSNEELQTLNEELETSKEEIESANEELTTTNQELQTRNDLLNEAYDYSEAVFATIHEPMLVLDKNLRVKSANKTFYKIFNTNEEQTEGMLLYDLGDKKWNIQQLKVLLEDVLPRNSHFHNFEITHNFPVIGKKTMLLNARRIIQKTNQEELILLAFSDVTEVRRKAIELKIAENEILLLKINEEQILRKTIEESEKRYNLILMQSPFAFAVLKGKDMVITLANNSIKKIWGKGDKIEGKPLVEILPEIKGQEFPTLLNQVYTTGIPYMSHESIAHMKQKGKMKDMYFDFAYQPYIESNGDISGVIIFASDVTEQVEGRKRIEESEKQLRITTDHFEIATMASEIGIWSLDIAKQSLVWSNLHKEMWGYSNLDLIHKYDDWHKLIVKEDKEIVFTEVARALETKTMYDVNYRIKRADNGDLRWINSTGRYLFNDVGEPITFSGISIDITEQKKTELLLKESERRFRNLIEQAPVAICVFRGNNFIYEVANENHLQLIGKTKEQVINLPVFKALPEAVGQGFEELLEGVYNTGIPYNAKEFPTTLMRNGKKETIYTNFIYKPIYDNENKIDGVFALSIDVTEQVLARQVIEESKKDLLEAKLLAETAVKYKQQFLSNMSHEIRTPLNSILGFANVLLKTEKNAEQKEFLQAIEASGNSLNMLINDILDLAKVDSGKMVFVKQAFELRKSIKSILYSFELKVKEKNLELKKEIDSNIPAILLGDSIRLNQIILNLISNAVKFTHKGEIKLCAKLLNEDKENINIQFSISDTGIGIPNNKIKSIFNLFEQAELHIANSYGGTGLGLAIVKQLIEAQGGSISVSSKIGKGSVFSFILSFGKTHIKLKEEISALKLDSEIKNMRVLVAEDIALNQLLIKIILTDFGFEFDIVENGKLAIEKMKNNTYDIILMDLQMPIMSGFEATEYIRKTLKSKIPIIALTADVTTADVSKSHEFGMDDYISKPFNEKILYHKMVDLVKTKQ